MDELIGTYPDLLLPWELCPFHWGYPPWNQRLVGFCLFTCVSLSFAHLKKAIYMMSFQLARYDIFPWTQRSWNAQSIESITSLSWSHPRHKRDIHFNYPHKMPPQWGLVTTFYLTYLQTDTSLSQVSSSFIWDFKLSLRTKKSNSPFQPWRNSP